MPPKSILIVEDNADLRSLYKQAVEMEGYEPLVAGNGLEALEILRTTNPDPKVIILDLMMPVMDGYAFLDFLRQRADADRFGVLVVSADFEVPDTVAQHPGVIGVLHKPFDLGDVLRVVHAFQQ